MIGLFVAARGRAARDLIWLVHSCAGSSGISRDRTCVERRRIHAMTDSPISAICIAAVIFWPGQRVLALSSGAQRTPRVTSSARATNRVAMDRQLIKNISID
jgi:hypothetical protein